MSFDSKSFFSAVIAPFKKRKKVRPELGYGQDATNYEIKLLPPPFSNRCCLRMHAAKTRKIEYYNIPSVFNKERR
jgi:hypothetical protein